MCVEWIAAEVWMMANEHMGRTQEMTQMMISLKLTLSFLNGKGSTPLPKILKEPEKLRPLCHFRCQPHIFKWREPRTSKSWLISFGIIMPFLSYSSSLWGPPLLCETLVPYHTLIFFLLVNDIPFLFQFHCWICCWRCCYCCIKAARKWHYLRLLFIIMAICCLLNELTLYSSVV